MAKKKLKDYVKAIVDAITKRCGSYDDFLDSAVQDMAMNKMLLDKLHDEIMNAPLTTLTVGSQGQQKQEVNPLLVQYKDVQKILLLQHEALGLNYLTTPSKVKEGVKTGVDESDPMARFLGEMIKR